MTVLIALTVLISLSPAPTSAQEASSNVVQWLRTHAVRFDLGGENTFSFLDPFLDESDVVSIGEEIHGVHEFLEVKRRLTLHLVRKHGFRVVALEDGTIKAHALNEFVRTGAGDPGRLLYQYYWCWNTKEIRELVESLRKDSIERGSQDALTFVGVDCQSSKFPLALLEKEASPESQGAARVIAELRSVLWDGRRDYVKRSSSEKAVDQGKIEQLRGLTSGSAEALRVLAQVQQLWSCSDNSTRMNLRDRFMAENLIAAQERAEGARTILLGHNAHIGREKFYGYVTPMGAHLEERRPGKQLVIGLFFCGGTVTPDPRQNVEEAIKTVSPDSLASTLASVDLSSYAVVFRGKNPDTSVRMWLDNPPPGHFKNYGDSPSLLDSYDAIIVFKDASPARVRNPNLARKVQLAEALNESRWDEALQIIEMNIEENSQDLSTWRAKFDLLAVRQRDREAASACGAEILEKFGDDARELNKLAWALLTEKSYLQGYDDLALRMSRRSNTITNNQNWMYLDTLALANFQTGRMERAIEIAELAIERCDGNERSELKKTLKKFQRAQVKDRRL